MRRKTYINLILITALMLGIVLIFGARHLFFEDLYPAARMQDVDADGGQRASKAEEAGEKEPQNRDVERKKVALTFDDGPNEDYTPQLLDGLKERGVHATFFVLGEEAQAHPELMQRLVDEGHLIGNHTYHHVDLGNLTKSAAREEIEQTNRIIEHYTGEPTCFLRPPFGSSRDGLENEVEMLQVLWTVDTMDWACQDEGQICDTVYKNVKENSIILMHDAYPTSVRAALAVVDCLMRQGYEFVTVDEILMD